MGSRFKSFGAAVLVSCAIAVGEVEGAEGASAAPEAGVIAYARVTGDYWQIWTYELALREHRQRTSSAVDKRDPSWRADGAIVFRSHNDELFVLEAEADEPTPLRDDIWPAFDPAWAPGDPRIAVAKVQTDLKDASAIWLVGMESGDQRVLTRGSGLRTHPVWSSDGSRLTYIRSFGYRGSELRTIRLADGEETVLLKDRHHNVHPEWSPDDKSIVYVSDRSGDYEIYIRELASGEDRRLTERSGLDVRPTFSPDGQHIAYTSFVDGRLELWTVAEDGTAASRLFECETDVSDPAWR
jgi:TolB protein